MIEWTFKAKQDLSKILIYIAKNFNLDLADKIVDEVMCAVDAILSRNPLAGKLYEENLLFSVLIYEGNEIYYCEHPRAKKIYIVYVKPRKTSFDSMGLILDEVIR